MTGVFEASNARLGRTPVLARRLPSTLWTIHAPPSPRWAYFRSALATSRYARPGRPAALTASDTCAPTSALDASMTAAPDQSPAGERVAYLRSCAAAS